MKLKAEAIVMLWAALALSDGYKILCVFPVPTASHNILGRGIVNALLKAGHSVSWVTPYPELVKEPVENLTILDVSATKSVFAGLNMSDFRNTSPSKTLPISSKIATLAATSSDVVQAMISDQFDAVVTEWFLTDLPAGYAAVQQAPWIMLSSVGAHTYLEHLVDEVATTALLPAMQNKANIPMNYWERLLNSILTGGLQMVTWGLRTYHSSLYFDLFGPMATARGTVLSPLSEVYNNVSVLLINSHPSYTPAQSLPPNVVEIGGYHIEENKTLPKDLQQFLDASTQGFVYFSMGSVVEISTLPSTLKMELLHMFEELPYNVVWKSDELLTGLPKNVFMRSWLPQSGILAHPNIKLFITHGGLLSITEAVHYGVPLLVIPVYGDQPRNADRAVAAGYAVKVDFHIRMAKELKAGLNEMVQNDSYYKTVKYISKLFHSRPVAPTKLIAHYVEVAIESKGAYHLRSAARHYTWYQRKRLDQLLGSVLLFYGLYVACRIVVHEIKRKTRAKKND